MKCPYCLNTETKVVDKRNTDEGIRRRRECLKCAKRFTTHEKVQQIDITVLKRSGKREPFDRNKIIMGIERATQKRQTPEEVEAIVERIEKDVKKLKSTEVLSTKIGGLVMRYLKRVDKISYLRYASVYQGFEDVEEFEEELKKLVKK